LFTLVSNDTHDVGLPAIVVNGIAHGFSVDRQTFVDYPVLCIPGLEGLVQFHRVNSNEYVTYGTFAGDAVFFATEATAESVSCRW